MERERADGLDVAPDRLRAAMRAGRYSKPTAGVARGWVQANLVVVPQRLAFDFLLFAQRNPRPCPVLDVTDAGSAEPRGVAPGADLRTDLPRYRVYVDGVLQDEPAEVAAYWRDDLVAFLLGCSFTFETAMLRAGLSVRHIEEGCNVPMFVTDRPCRPAGAFQGPMVVSMRPIPADLVARAVQVTSRFPGSHGAPIHVGDPGAIGIEDLSRPDFGDPVEVRSDETPLFWACGVTPQVALAHAKPDLAITHAPGHMFITDLLDESLAVI